MGECDFTRLWTGTAMGKGGFTRLWTGTTIGVCGFTGLWTCTTIGVCDFTRLWTCTIIGECGFTRLWTSTTKVRAVVHPICSVYFPPCLDFVHLSILSSFLLGNHSLTVRLATVSNNGDDSLTLCQSTQMFTFHPPSLDPSIIPFLPPSLTHSFTPSSAHSLSHSSS